AGTHVEDEAADRIYLILRQLDLDLVERAIHDALDVLLEQLDRFCFGEATGKVLAVEHEVSVADRRIPRSVVISLGNERFVLADPGEPCLAHPLPRQLRSPR